MTNATATKAAITAATSRPRASRARLHTSFIRRLPGPGGPTPIKTGHPPGKVRARYLIVIPPDAPSQGP
ncbi:hypothetical protein GCM10027614_69190 [Micromonospora vulcania]